MKMSAAVQELIGNFKLGFVATVTPGGRPSLSPKGTFLILDDETIAFGEVRSPQTITNLSHQPEVEVNFADVFTRKAVRVRGEAVLVRKGSEEFETLIPKWVDGFGDLAERINVIVKIPIASVKPMSSPVYDDGATEEAMIALWKGNYSEIYP